MAIVTATVAGLLGVALASGVLDQPDEEIATLPNESPTTDDEERTTETPTEPSPENEPFELQELAFEGDGDSSTEPFELAGGRYLVEWTTQGTCAWSWWLGDPDTGRFPHELGSADGRSDNYEGAGSDNVFGIPAGEFFLDTITGDDCPWMLTLTRTE